MTSGVAADAVHQPSKGVAAALILRQLEVVSAAAAASRPTRPSTKSRTMLATAVRARSVALSCVWLSCWRMIRAVTSRIAGQSCRMRSRPSSSIESSTSSATAAALRSPLATCPQRSPRVCRTPLNVPMRL
jgi:hypothetical protein